MSSAYVTSVLGLIYTWRNYSSADQAVPSYVTSVIVPFRNEAAHLEHLVNSLQKQEYSPFEVLFVNDHSDDSSLEILDKVLSDVNFKYQVIDLKGSQGKKAAISLGVVEASGEIILTTDADCNFGPHWVKSMTEAFATDDIQMVSGPVALEGETLFQQWQQMEFAVLIVTGAIGIALRKPSMANGANLAYRKKAFQTVHGFEGVENLASGDDEFLLMKIQREFPGGISFLKRTKALVKTSALASWQEFQNQRLRWAGKWRYGKRVGTIAGALAVFLFNLSLLVLPVLALFKLLPWWLVALVFGSRFFVETLLVTSLSAFFQYKLSAKALFLHQILYPFYAVYFGVAANFAKYSWKGRSYRP